MESFGHRRYANDQYVYELVWNIVSHQKRENGNHTHTKVTKCNVVSCIWLSNRKRILVKGNGEIQIKSIVWLIITYFSWFSSILISNCWPKYHCSVIL